MKKLLAILLAVSMLFAFAACQPATPSETPSEDPASTEPDAPTTKTDISMAVMIYDFNDTYISTVRAAIEKYAGENAANITLNLQDGKGDQAAQNDQMDIVLTQNPDVILINAVDAKSAQGLADKAVAAGVPFIFFNREPDAAVMQGSGSLFVGTTASEAGVMQGDILAELFAADSSIDKNGDGKLQYLVFKGEPGNPEAEARSKFCVDQAVAKGLDMDPIQKDPVVANWKTSEASDAMTALLGANKDKIEVVFCNNDDMALGVIAALQGANMNKGGKADGDWIPVIGVDATDAGMDAVGKGTMYGTVKQDGDAMGKALVEVAVNAANDVAFPFLDGTSYQLDADGVSIRIPYAPVK